MNEHNQLVMANIISGVETGGQRYGYGRWNDYTRPYKNTSGEHTCTLGAFQFYGGEARQLCQLIYNTDKATFKKYDTCSPSIESMLGKDWVGIRWNPSSSQAAVLSNIISTEVGITCQKKLFAEIQLKSYEKRAIEFGVKDVRAIMMWIEIQHLGGGNAPKRIFTRCNGDYSVDNILRCLNPKYADYNKYRNPVEAQLFWSRHVCCATWVKQYAQDENGSNVTIPQTKYLTVGCKGDDVKDLQGKLMYIGLADCSYYTNTKRFIDGDYGDTTRKSVVALQKIARLEQDGVFGNDTSAVLEMLYKEAKESKFNITVSQFLSNAKTVTDSVRSWTYGNAAFLPVYGIEKYVSCDRFVDYVLYKSGLKNVGNREVGMLEQYLKDIGCKKITSKNDVSAGDIIFFKGHVFILGNKKGNNLYERYDCGSTARIQSNQPSIEDINGFVSAYRLPFKVNDSGVNKKDDTKTSLVKCGQKHLNNYIGAGLVIDGVYGNATREAFVKALQTALNRQYNCGLEVDGVFGAKTEGALKKHPALLNTKGDLATVLAIGLYINGIDANGLVANEKLIAVLKDYQKKHNLEVDGVAGIKTFKSLATVK